MATRVYSSHIRTARRCKEVDYGVIGHVTTKIRYLVEISYSAFTLLYVLVKLVKRRVSGGDRFQFGAHNILPFNQNISTI